MFTMMVLIVFNLMSPIGWKIGFARLEDILVGASVGLVVSVLLWPRGGAAAVQRAIDDALVVGSRYLTAAVNRVTGVPPNRPTTPSSRCTGRPSSRCGPMATPCATTCRSGGAIDTAMLDTTNRIPGCAPPGTTSPTSCRRWRPTKARRVLERHTAAVCGGRPRHSAAGHSATSSFRLARRSGVRRTRCGGGPAVGHRGRQRR